MVIFLLSVLAAVCCLFLIKTITKLWKTKEYVHWGLGVDVCCFYSPPFTVHNRQVTIAGFQEILEQKGAIRYSIVNTNLLGKRTVYGRGVIFGNYQIPNSFQLTFKNIPNGSNYKIEVFSSFHMCFGQFQIFKAPLQSNNQVPPTKSPENNC